MRTSDPAVVWAGRPETRRRNSIYRSDRARAWRNLLVDEARAIVERLDKALAEAGRQRDLLKALLPPAPVPAPAANAAVLTRLRA